MVTPIRNGGGPLANGTLQGLPPRRQTTPAQAPPAQAARNANPATRVDAAQAAREAAAQAAQNQSARQTAERRANAQPRQPNQTRPGQALDTFA